MAEPIENHLATSRDLSRIPSVSPSQPGALFTGIEFFEPVEDNGDEIGPASAPASSRSKPVAAHLPLDASEHRGVKDGKTELTVLARARGRSSDYERGLITWSLYFVQQHRPVEHDADGRSSRSLDL